MTDTPYTPEDVEDAERKPEPASDKADVEPSKHDHSDGFDPDSPAADAPAVF